MGWDIPIKKDKSFLQEEQKSQRKQKYIDEEKQIKLKQSIFTNQQEGIYHYNQDQKVKLYNKTVQKMYLVQEKYLLLIDLNHIILLEIETKKILDKQEYDQIIKHNYCESKQVLQFMYDNTMLQIFLVENGKLIKKISIENNDSNKVWPLAYLDDQQNIYIYQDNKILKNEKEFISLDKIDNFYIYQNYIMVYINSKIYSKEKSIKDGKVLIYKDKKFLKEFELDNNCYQEHIQLRDLLLIKTESTIDISNKSYYGQNSLYLFQPDNVKIVSIQIGSNKIQSIQPQYNNNQYIIIHGNMPAKIDLYNKDILIQNLTSFYGNHACFSKKNDLLFIGGFQNLPGDFIIFEMGTKQIIGKQKSFGGHEVCWSHDGFQVVIQSINPKLRIDNYVKFFNFRGELIKFYDFKHTELYQAIVQPTENIEWRKRILDTLTEKDENIKFSDMLKNRQK